MEWNISKYLSPVTGKKIQNYFLIKHVTPVPFKLPPSFLFTPSFTAAINWFKQKYQTHLSVVYNHYKVYQMNVNSKHGTFSM